MDCVSERYGRNQSYQETTHQRVFEGTREQCFKYYKTHVDIFKNQFKRIAVLKEL